MLERLWTGGLWTEGPCYFPGYVVWSDIPNDRMMRWDEITGEVTVYRRPANFTNGHNRDAAGRLVSCEHGMTANTLQPSGRSSMRI